MKVNAMAFSGLMRELLDGAYTLNELSERTGLHKITIGRYLRALHARRVVVVAGWVGDGRETTRVWSMARSTQTRDIERPPPLSGSERSRRYRKSKGIKTYPGANK